MEYNEVLLNHLIKLRFAYCMPMGTIYEDGRTETSYCWVSEEAKELYDKLLQLRADSLNQMVDNAALCIGQAIMPRKR